MHRINFNYNNTTITTATTLNSMGTYLHIMVPNNGWFNEPNESEQTGCNRILQYIRNVPLCYSTEISNKLNLDSRTVKRWINYLLSEGHIARIDMCIAPTPEQSARIKELRDGGMKKNHFKNAIWYCAVEKEDE